MEGAEDITEAVDARRLSSHEEGELYDIANEKGCCAGIGVTSSFCISHGNKESLSKGDIRSDDASVEGKAVIDSVTCGK